MTTDAQFKDLVKVLKKINRLDLWFRGGAKKYFMEAENPTSKGCIEFLLQLHSIELNSEQLQILQSIE